MFLHLPFGYFPDVHGGTEVYVAALCRALNALGHDSRVAAPGSGLARYKQDGVEVYRYPVDQNATDTDRNGPGDPLAADHVGRLLDELEPDVVHLHALTSGVSLRVLREARQRGIKTVLTYHTPTVSCARGTLLHMGQSVCDGVLDERRCTACSLNGLGLGRAVSDRIARVPRWVGRAVSVAGRQARWITALRRREMVSVRHQAIRAVFAEVDWVIVLCDWTAELLHANGLATGKTEIVRHALPHRMDQDLPAQTPVPAKFTHDEPLRLIYLGRIAPEKGVDVIVQAISMLPAETPVKLDIFGLRQDDGAHVQKVIRDASADERIQLHDPVAPEAVTALLRQYHLLMVPSQWLETGPFVVLEGLSAGTPVMGCALGGVEERLRGGGGWLIDEYTRPGAWAEKLRRLVDRPGRIAVAREEITPPDEFDVVAKQHAQLYQTLHTGKQS